jgi:hypothetical protein
MKKSTYSIAYETCVNYFSETGLIPTIEAIKSIIGTNSPNVISSAIKDWKKDLANVAKHSPVKTDLPPALINAMSAIWKQALLEANNSYNEKLSEVIAQKAELTEKESRLKKEGLRIQHLLKLTEQKHKTETTILKEELARLSRASSKCAEQLEQAQSTLSGSKKENAILSGLLDHERKNFARLEKQYNKEHEWAIKRIEEEKDSIKENNRKELQKIKAESEQNNQLKKLFQTKYDSAYKQLNGCMQKIIELERNLENEKLAQVKLGAIAEQLKNGLDPEDERKKFFASKPRIKKNNNA